MGISSSKCCEGRKKVRVFSILSSHWDNKSEFLVEEVRRLIREGFIVLLLPDRVFLGKWHFYSGKKLLVYETIVGGITSVNSLSITGPGLYKPNI